MAILEAVESKYNRRLPDAMFILLLFCLTFLFVTVATLIPAG